MLGKWIKDLLGITKLETENEKLKKSLEFTNNRLEHFSRIINNQAIHISNKLAELQEYTRVDADVGMRGNNTIILTGVFRNQAYVKFYDLGDGEFRQLVEQLQYMREHALIRHIDAPHTFKGIFNL